MSDIIRSHQQKWGDISATGTRSVRKASGMPKTNQQGVEKLRKALKRSEKQRAELEHELEGTRSILSNIMARLKTADKIANVENSCFEEEMVRRYGSFKKNLTEVTSNFEIGLGGLVIQELKKTRTAIRSIVDNLDVEQVEDPTNDDSSDIYLDGGLSTSATLHVVREKFSDGDSFTLSNLSEWLQLKNPNMELSQIQEVIEKRCEAGLKENNKRTITQKKIGVEVLYYLKDLALSVDVDAIGES